VTGLALHVAFLASYELQVKYIANATPEEYLLPDELVHLALVAVEKAPAHERALAGRFGMELRRLAASIDFEAIDFRVLVEENPDWAAIRKLAQETLEALGEELPEDPDDIWRT
jgi:hypothetical protein